MKTTTTKKTSTVKKTATPAKKTVSRAKPAAKRPAKKAPAKKASGNAPRADLDAVRASERRAGDAMSRAVRARVHHSDRDRLTRKTRAIRRRSRSRSVTARRGSTVRFRATADSTRSSSERSRNTCNSRHADPFRLRVRLGHGTEDEKTVHRVRLVARRARDVDADATSRYDVARETSKINLRTSHPTGTLL